METLQWHVKNSSAKHPLASPLRNGPGLGRLQASCGFGKDGAEEAGADIARSLASLVFFHLSKFSP